MRRWGVSLPEKGALNLQQAVRELEKRIEALENKQAEVVDAQPEAGSTPEPPKAD